MSDTLIRCMKCKHIDTADMFDVLGADDGKVFCQRCGEETYFDDVTVEVKQRNAAMAEDARDGRREDAAIAARNREEDEGSRMACNDHDGLS